ncbi:hypothetical protein KIPB_013094, partial [Kipferlia bialata]
VGMKPLEVVRIDRRLYLLCSRMVGDEAGPLWLFCYDLDLGQWVPGGEVQAQDNERPVGRHSPLFFALDGCIILTGGSLYLGGVVLSDVWSFDPRLGHWTHQVDVPYPVYCPGVGVLSSKAYLFGGKTTFSGNHRATYLTLTLIGGATVWGEPRPCPVLTSMSSTPIMSCMDMGEWLLIRERYNIVAFRPSPSGQDDEWRGWWDRDSGSSACHTCRLSPCLSMSITLGIRTEPIGIQCLPPFMCAAQLRVPPPSGTLYAQA